ncbi:MAG: nucleotidyltransferase family protein [Coleofasciculaceae cyanobacterium]
MRDPHNPELEIMPSVGLIILAAGASTRLGTPKQLLRYGGQSLLFHAAQTAVASVCKPVLIVLGAYAELLKQEVQDLPVQVVENPHWQEGMGASIGTGIKAINSFSDNIEAVVLMLCDQPFVSVDVINNLVKSSGITKHSIVASQYQETFGVPALFKRTLFGELLSLRSAEGAKKIITKYSSEVDTIAFANGVIDIDTPGDYEAFLKMVG